MISLFLIATNILNTNTSIQDTIEYNLFLKELSVMSDHSNGCKLKIEDWIRRNGVEKSLAIDSWDTYYEGDLYEIREGCFK